MRTALLSALLVALLTCAVVTAQSGQQTPLVTNGGFEEGLEGWQADAAYELVTDAEAVHGGQNCITGEVTEPNTHLTLARDFDLKAGALYTLIVWARGTNRTKIAVWRTTEAGDRKNVAQWQDQRPQWRLNQAPFTVETSGKWRLDLIAPSSHGSPAGRVWLDDIQLTETYVPPPIDVSQGVGFNDLPRMVRAGDGLYSAWISFRDAADTLQVARTSLTGEVQQTWQVVGGKGTYLLDPYLVADADNAWLLYSAEVDGDWEIFAARITPAGAGEPIRLTSEAGGDVKPAGALYGDALWVAWEASRKGRRQIQVVAVRDGKPGKASRVSAPDTSNYEPVLAAAEGGPLVLAWSAYQNGNNDIALVRFDGRGWGKPETLTSAPTIDRHVALCPAGREMWIAWENANSRAYKVGASSSRRLAVARLAPEGLMAPVCLKQSPLWQWGESAELLADNLGRLWVACLRPRDKNSGWDVFLHCLTGDSCSAPYRATTLKGMDRPLSLALADDRIIVGFQGDTIPRGWQTIEQSTEGASGSYLAILDISDAPAPQPIATELYVEPDDVYEAGQLRIARGEEQASRSIRYDGETLKLYYGDLHEHTDVSVCNRTGDQSIDESYQSMRDICRYDFACATDHGYNINEYLWNYTAKLARSNEDLGRFLTFLAEEWTSSIEEYSDKYPEGFYGHRNLILEDPYWPWWYNSRDRSRPTELWKKLDEQGASYVHIPHQLADTGNVPCDWDEVDEKSQPVAEIFQARGSYEYEGAPRQAGRTLTGAFIQDAWAKGVVIGIIASPDHGGGMGKAAVFAPELSRKAILDAIRKRHTYGTTAAKIFLDVRVEERLMGEKLTRNETRPVTIEVNAVCPAEIGRIDICRNNEFICTKEGESQRVRFTFQDTDPLTGPSYYYVRVIQKDEEIAWSSPVWLQPG